MLQSQRVLRVPDIEGQGMHTESQIASLGDGEPLDLIVQEYWDSYTKGNSAGSRELRVFKKHVNALVEDEQKRTLRSGLAVDKQTFMQRVRGRILATFCLL